MQFCRDLVNVAKYAFLPGKKKQTYGRCHQGRQGVSFPAHPSSPHPAPDYESGVFSLLGASPRKAITIYTEELFKNRNKVKYHHCLNTSPPNLLYDREPNKGTNVQQLWHNRRSIFLISKRTHVVQLYFYFLQLCKMITC